VFTIILSIIYEIIIVSLLIIFELHFLRTGLYIVSIALIGLFTDWLSGQAYSFGDFFSELAQTTDMEAN